MKKQYGGLEMRVVNIPQDKSISQLATMSDDDLREALKDLGCMESKVYYQAAEDFVSRDIVGETVLVPVGEQAQKLNGFATFTETGQFLWNILSENKHTKEELVLAISKEYRVPKEEIQSDIDYYLAKMMKNGFVIQCR